MGSGTGEIQNAELQKETWGQFDGNSICLQGQRGRKQGQGQGLHNQKQVGKGSSHQDRLRQIFQAVAWEHRNCQGLSAGLWG